jgi:hypothetical protein
MTACASVMSQCQTMRDHDVSALTSDELERARRQLLASLALLRAGSPARVPIDNQMRAIDAEWNRRRLP